MSHTDEFGVARHISSPAAIFPGSPISCANIDPNCVILKSCRFILIPPVFVGKVYGMPFDLFLIVYQHVMKVRMPFLAEIVGNTYIF